MSKIIKLKIPFGERYLLLSLPKTRLTCVVQSNNHRPASLHKIFSQLDTDLLALNRSLCHKKNILIVVPDNTRNAHLKHILPRVLNQIDKKGRKIDIIIASGLHKKCDKIRTKHLLGDAVAGQYKVINHSPLESSVTKLGFTKMGVPIYLNKAITRHDSIISIGVVEPHLYAGYSGGYKTVAIGLAGAKTINCTHNVKFLKAPLTKIGLIYKNPFQDTLREIGSRVPIDFCINTVNDLNGKILKIFSGDIKKVFPNAVDFAQKILEVEVNTLSDVVICGIGYPKDINLYQASRVINYILNVDNPVLKKGGVLIIAAQLRDGIGYSKAEKRFYYEISNVVRPETYVEKIEKNGCVAGEHRAYMVANPLRYYRVAFVANPASDFMHNLPFPSFKNFTDALNHAESIVGKQSKICVIPHALGVITKFKK